MDSRARLLLRLPLNRKHGPPPAPWPPEAGPWRCGSSPKSSCSGPSSPSPSSYPSSSSAGTWRGGRCWCTSRWCRRSSACAGRSRSSPSPLTAAASPGSTSSRNRGTVNLKGPLKSRPLLLCKQTVAFEPLIIPISNAILPNETARFLF